MTVNNRDELEDTPLTLKIPAVNRCVRCGMLIFKGKKEIRLRCNHCREYVDAELNGGDEHPFNFYFQHYQEGKSKSNVRDAEKRSKESLTENTALNVE